MGNIIESMLRRINMGAFVTEEKTEEYSPLLSSSMSGFVPEGIVEEILHRLPPKSIGKCMAVCKSWNLLIKSHRFVYSYHEAAHTPPLFLVKTSRYQGFLCSQSPPNIECLFSIPKVKDVHIFVGAVNGLVCLCSSYQPRRRDSNMNFILFNPLIRRHLQLPISQTLYNSGKDLNLCWGYGLDLGLGYGFGFDSKKKDFKVVHMCYTRGFEAPPKVELYSLNEGAWRVLNTPFVKPTLDQYVFRYVHCCGEQLFFQDSVHWLVKEVKSHLNLVRSGILKSHIVMFDVAEEKFSKMELPEVLATSKRSLKITVIDGCLSLIEYPEWFEDTNVWMKRESWSKTYSVSLLKGYLGYLLGQNMSSQVLLVPRYRFISPREIMSMHSYDLKSQETRDLGNLGVKSTVLNVYASDFTCSLILLDKESYADDVREQDDESN